MLDDPIKRISEAVDTFGRRIARGERWVSKDEGDAQETPGPILRRKRSVEFSDFVAYMPSHQYIYKPTREMWPGGSVDSRLPKVKIGVDKNGKDVEIRASQFIDKNQPVEQMTWAPGLPMLIKDRLVADGGWIERRGVTVFNLYKPPSIEPGDASKAGRWVDHVRKVYPESADHIIKWLASRVQHPYTKINHAIVLGGNQGVGKDTILEPVKSAIGPWNFSEVSPVQMMGRFNGFLKSVILRVSEARDLGDTDRYGFYEHTKPIIAAPPDVLRVDEKNLREHAVFNVVGVVITTNNKSNGIYLPADDRRHYVAWSDLSRTDFAEDYFTSLYEWFTGGGDRQVAAYLSKLDLAGSIAEVFPFVGLSRVSPPLGTPPSFQRSNVDQDLRLKAAKIYAQILMRINSNTLDPIIDIGQAGS